tara:strand:+ start:165 stop:884 length:720 start_codon:yes stop_codon:yes gene_type:complete
MEKISPLLHLRGEVLINFMSDFINRFIDDPRPNIAATFDTLFGGDWYQEWKELVDQGLSRESAAIEVYTIRLKRAGNFQFVTSTRILKPQADRSYFYLIYATQHWKGIQEFRGVEKKAIATQESVRNAAKYKAQVERSGMESLFGQQFSDMAAGTFEDEKRTQFIRGHEKLIATIKAHPNGIEYGQLLGEVLQTPLIWESELKAWINDLRRQDKVTIPQLKPSERVPKPDYAIIPTNSL